MFMGAVPGHMAGEEVQVAGLAAYQLLREEVVSAQAKRVINEPDADSVAMTMWGLVHGLVSLEITNAGPAGKGGPHSFHDRPFHDRTFEMALHTLEQGLLAGAPARRTRASTA